jgi:hypothetical protein
VVNKCYLGTYSSWYVYLNKISEQKVQLIYTQTLPIQSVYSLRYFSIAINIYYGISKEKFIPILEFHQRLYNIIIRY